jgi:hypothetical protein
MQAGQADEAFDNQNGVEMAPGRPDYSGYSVQGHDSVEVEVGSVIRTLLLSLMKLRCAGVFPGLTAVNSFGIESGLTEK